MRRACRTRHPGTMSAVHYLAAAGTAIGVMGAASLALQARRLLLIGTACEISIPVRLVTLTGYAVWLAYGIAIRDMPLILVDLAGLAGAGLVLHITLVLRRRRACPVGRAPVHRGMRARAGMVPSTRGSATIAPAATGASSATARALGLTVGVTSSATPITALARAVAPG
jgi:MtN3 and saliva related transmembrane protein